MPRRKLPPRLYLDSTRNEWVIRDGSRFVRTSCTESERDGAENRLAAYLGQKHRPSPGPDPLIADILLAYNGDHIPNTRSAKTTAYYIGYLEKWWGDKKLSEVTARNCRLFAKDFPAQGARRYLEVLRAAIKHYHVEHGPLPSIPAVVLPAKAEPRTRWLTRDEARRLRRAARGVPHLSRFIILGLYTGSRRGVLFNLRWDWIDLARGVMLRREPGEAESKKRRPPVRLGKALQRLLRRWRSQDDSPYVIHFKGKKIGRQITTSWRKAVKRAGLGSDVTPHCLRRTRATWLMQAGVDPWEAAGHLGMSLQMLERVYAQQHPDFQKRAAEV